MRVCKSEEYDCLTRCKAGVLSYMGKTLLVWIVWLAKATPRQYIETAYCESSHKTLLQSNSILMRPFPPSFSSYSYSTRYFLLCFVYWASARAGPLAVRLTHFCRAFSLTLIRLKVPRPLGISRARMVATYREAPRSPHCKKPG